MDELKINGKKVFTLLILFSLLMLVDCTKREMITELNLLLVTDQTVLPSGYEFDNYRLLKRLRSLADSSKGHHNLVKIFWGQFDSLKAGRRVWYDIILTEDRNRDTVLIQDVIVSIPKSIDKKMAVIALSLNRNEVINKAIIKALAPKLRDKELGILCFQGGKEDLKYILEELRDVDLVFWKPMGNIRRFDGEIEGKLVVSLGGRLPYALELQLRFPEGGPRHFINLEEYVQAITRVKDSLYAISNGRYKEWEPERYARNKEEYQQAIELEQELSILQREYREITCGYYKRLIPLFRITAPLK